MATALTSIISQTRTRLLESTAKYWSDAELLEYINLGIKDLWKPIVDLYEEHFLTIDATNVSISASATEMSGVPTDAFRVHTIEPADLTTTGSARGLLFIPRDYNHPDFVQARARTAISPLSNEIMYYKLVAAGPPVGAPTILCAPKLTTAVAAGDIRLAYVPTIAAKTSGQDNPIPGESDNALIAWTMAYARAREREDRSPDPNQLAIYNTEKTNLLTVLTPRDEQEQETVEAVFEAWTPS